LVETMPTNTQHDLQRERLLAACRIQPVADAAGIALALWSSTTSPRVISTNGQGYVGALHRGRLPMIELYQGDDSWERQTRGCGTTRTEWIVRVHVNGPSWSTADSLARGILQTALAAIRSDAYMVEGGETISQLEATPLGFAVQARVGLIQTFERDSYNTGIVITPGSPIVVVPGVGGYTVLIPWNVSPNPVTAWTLPANCRLDNIEVHVVESWDGVGAAITIGKAGSPSYFYDATQTELAVADVTFEQDFDEAGPLPIIVTVTPGTGATKGSVRLQITVTEAGS
jgi:hypothetical protein